MRKITLFASLMWLALLAGTAVARDNWQVIGTVVFDDPWQRSVIGIPAGTGPLTAVRFDVKGSDVEIGDIKLVYANGEVDDITVRDTFKAGSSSRRIDLRGALRKVKQVTVIYRTHGKARFNVLGDVAASAPAWTELGCKSVGFMVDRDVIKVGRGEGTFTALKLRVAGAPVEFFDVSVVYGNGQRDTLSVRSVIRPGGETRALDLSGKQRGIDRIELLYRSIPSFKGKAAVCADGKQRN